MSCPGILKHDHSKSTPVLTCGYDFYPPLTQFAPRWLSRLWQGPFLLTRFAAIPVLLLGYGGCPPWQGQSHSRGLALAFFPAGVLETHCSISSNGADSIPGVFLAAHLFVGR